MRISLEDLEESSNVLVESLKNVLSSSPRTYLVYEASTQGLARHMRIAIKVAKAGTSVELVDADTFPNVELPYVAEDRVPAVALLKSFSAVHRVATALRLLGVEHLIVAPQLPHHVKRALRGANVVELRRDLYALSIVLGSLKLAASLGNNPRISRIAPELELSPELVEEVRDRFSRLSLVREKPLLCSSMLEAVCNAASDRGLKAVPIRVHPECTDGILVYTSVEDWVASEFVVNYLRRCPGKRIESVRVNTDPLTAPLYVLIALEEILGNQG